MQRVSLLARVVFLPVASLAGQPRPSPGAMPSHISPFSADPDMDVVWRAG
ncbi:MAG TPA: hypothetical protein VHD63_27535 [Ktedonobacteraceae bacterium]|nr:hypothetical protein [Ktedonobacteraceae bacterium]